MNTKNGVLQQRGDTNREIACIKWKLPVGNQEVAATNKNIERMGTAIYIACATDFVIDIAAFFMIKGGVVMSGKTYIMGFLGLSPASQNIGSVTRSTKLRHLAIFDNNLHQMLAEKDIHWGLPKMPGFIDNMTLITTSVKEVSEELVFVINGLLPQRIFEYKTDSDIPLTRQLAYNIFHAAKAAFKMAQPNANLPGHRKMGTVC